MVIYLQKNVAGFAGNYHNYNAHAPYTFAIGGLTPPPAVGLKDDVKIVFGGVDAMAIRQSEMKLGGI